MAKYISAEIAKKALADSNLIPRYVESCKPITDRIIDLLTAADVEPVKRWISTDERQPEKRGRYLVVEQNWLNKLNVQEAKWNGEDWLTVEKKREITPRVIYWMPLPEPPEMDGGVENE